MHKSAERYYITHNSVMASKRIKAERN